jgi:preprotein translocase subunit SecB
MPLKSAMKLEHYFFTNFQIIALQNYKFSKEQQYKSDNLEVKTAYKTSGKFPGIVQVQLHIKYSPQKKENIPYEFDISAVGFFRGISKSTDEIQLFLQVHAPALLYTAAREVISSMSARGPWGPIFLPIRVFEGTTKTQRKKKIQNKRSGN